MKAEPGHRYILAPGVELEPDSAVRKRLHERKIKFMCVSSSGSIYAEFEWPDHKYLNFYLPHGKVKMVVDCIFDG